MIESTYTHLILEKFNQLFRNEVEILLPPYFSHYFRGFFSGERSFERYVDYFYDVFKVTKAEKARVLDIGCGFGLMSIFLGSFGAAEVFGVDLDAEKIAGFKSLLKYVNIEDDSIKAEMGDALDIGYSPNSFDVIIVNDVLSHIRSLDIFLEEVPPLLKPEGRLYIYDDNNNLFLPNFFRYRKFWEMCEKGPVDYIACRGTDEQLPFSDMRREMILKLEPNFSSSQLKYLVNKTAGMYGKEIDAAVYEYKEAGKVRSRKGFKFRNPRTGEFPERPLNPFRISKILRDQGFSCSALPTFFFGKLTGFKGSLKRSLKQIFWLMPSLSFIMAPSFRILCLKKKTLTILYLFYEYLADGVGGLGHIWEVSKHLERLGHTVVIFAPRCGDYKVKESLDIRYVPTINVRFFRFLSFHFLLLFYLGYHMIRNKVDVLYVREMALSLTPLMLARIFKKPMITEINGDLLTEYEFAGHPQLFLEAMRSVEMIVLRMSQAVVCVTEGLRDVFQSRYHLSSEKIKVIPNGTDTDLFHPLDRSACRQELRIDTTIKLVGFVGTFVPHQGLSYLIRSAKLILEIEPHVTFLLVGDGPSCDDMVDMIQAMGLMDHFLFTGAVPRDKVVFYINAMDVCVAPFTSKRNERIGLSPLKIYDYLACGKPVVASDIKGVGDLLQQNEIGIAVRPEDPASLARGVLRALVDHDLAARCLQRGPAIIKKSFTWQITAQKVAKVCSEALG